MSESGTFVICVPETEAERFAGLAPMLDLRDFVVLRTDEAVRRIARGGLHGYVPLQLLGTGAHRMWLAGRWVWEWRPTVPLATYVAGQARTVRQHLATVGRGDPLVDVSARPFAAILQKIVDAFPAGTPGREEAAEAVASLQEAVRRHLED